ncbi:MAG: serine protease [Deltaproteobacteria bacterium]|nr:serine protease [Deltaproteobacteria bacterium]
MRPWLAVPGRLLFILLALIAAWPQAALALTASQVYEQVKDSVVVVRAYDQHGKPVGLGSGVRLPSGDVITNYHVVKAGVRYTVGQGKQGVPATVKAGDPDKDLCLLTAPGLTAKPARLGQAVKLKVGEPVYAVGAPQGLELSLSEGIVSQLRDGPPPLIQTTVAISKGSSGGGLFNAEAELVGITTFYLKDGQSLNFALPVEWIAEVAGKKIRERPRGEAPVAPEPGARSKEGWEDRGRALEKAQDWPGMLAHFRRWTKAEPGNELAWFSLALAYSEMGRYREAIEAYREALRLKPDFADAWNNLGVSYEKMGRYREAFEAFREALRLKPDYASAWNNLGNAYGNLGRHREAFEAFREALRLKPDDASAWNNLGNAYGNLGRYREAIEAYREALRLKPDYASAWCNLAIAYALSGNRSAALEAVKELRRYDPQKADKLFNLIMKL